MFALLALALAACDGGGSDEGGAEGSGGSSTGSGSGSPTTAGGSTSSGADSSASASGSEGSSSTTSGTGTTAGTTTAGETGGTEGTDESGESSAGETGTETSGSTTGESSLPIDCDDGDLPVRVDGGGSYATVGAGVAATPPEGTLYICPGEYTEDDSMVIDFPISVIGAGQGLVHIQSSATFGSGFSGAAFYTSGGVTLEGFTLEGGRYGVEASLNNQSNQSVVIRDVTLRGADASGFYAFALNPPQNTTITFDGAIVEGIEDGFDGAVTVYEIPTTFIDTVIRDNVSERGGLYIDNAPVTFQGGQVVRNTATSTSGGGAFIQSDFPYPEFQIMGSDWGEGAANENAPNDFDCGNSTDVGWLGDPADATCAVDNGACCTAT